MIVILIGDIAVEKSSIISKYVKGTYSLSQKSTVAVEFATKIVQLKEGGYIKAQIWDTAGQEQFKSLVSQHYRKATGAIFVYDVTKRSTFDSLVKWVKDFSDNVGGECVCALIGNKIDLIDKFNKPREVLYEEGKLFAKTHKMLFYEVSVVSNIMINECFSDIFQGIYNLKRKVDNINEENTVKIITTKKNNEQCC